MHAESYEQRLRVSLGLTCRSSAGGIGGNAVERSLVAALRILTDLDPTVRLPGLELLSERALAYRLPVAGAVSSGGATRFVRCADGWVALTLARPDDLAAVPALVASEVDEPWSAVEAWASSERAAEVLERCVLLGLACSVPGETVADVPWLIAAHPYSARSRPRVLDLSSLWAGPLCSWLLGQLGCEVVKMEDPCRPDGARQNPTWFARLYPDASYADLDDLDELLPTADIVIEASRPRALRHKGVRAEEFPGVWISITGYGRDQPDRIGFGDDAAVAGGLVGPGPTFVGDAVADPLTGAHAALATWALLSTGRGGIIDIALSRTAAAATTA